jgi:hypothetical protein
MLPRTSGPSLPAGAYNVKDPNTGDTMDLGWALNPQWGNNGPFVYLCSYNNGTSHIPCHESRIGGGDSYPIPWPLG